MIHPNVPAIMVTPICPHSLSFRPIVVPAGVELMVRKFVFRAKCLLPPLMFDASQHHVGVVWSYRSLSWMSSHHTSLRPDAGLAS